MKFNILIKKFFKSINLNLTFNFIEFAIFLVGLWLGATQNLIYILVCILVTALIYIIKILMEIKNDNDNEINILKDKISSIIITKNHSSVLYAPYIQDKEGYYEIDLTVSMLDENITSPLQLRIDYTGENFRQAPIIKDFVDDTNDHLMRYEDQKKCVQTIKADCSNGSKFLKFKFKTKIENISRLTFSLVDNTGRHISDLDIGSPEF
ncbi:hypothetical protein LLI816_06740 [Lactococcus lactis subsp. lactis]|uniref:hypothetical protein n=1 Tax=Lactococcus lactis TaxID=1358 RepID=UPI0007AE8A15|nr:MULTISPECIES: hypothetical protein [Lactococcus]KZK11937.1 hypothetical protein DRA4_1430 [Lactococcus lactis subsp. lactis bv. diacetylactis]MCO0817050.1 hypothetical protein [Lactococcus lactis]MCT3104690.1 hypothetical protein [Lactococcus lactis]MRM77399.1 hypothetical protein [Lactococcus cremoris]QTP11619.1 hypothetical protein LLDRC3_0843 [Lactococcus lactis subsp. lactis]